MGNCLLGGMSDPPDAVTKVITSNGGIMEFYAPVTVSFITNEFPGHGIFPSQDLFWKPLSELDELEAGHSYYLLPLDNQAEQQRSATTISCGGGSSSLVVRQGHVRSLSVPTTPHPPPYRMSLDYQHHQGSGLLKRNSKEHFSCRASISKSSRRTSTTTTTSISTSSSCRFWKVKLVITPERLLEILSQEARTKELIESVRIVAKGRGVGIGGGGCISSYAASAAASLVSEDWSLSSSGRSVNSSKIDALIVDI